SGYAAGVQRLLATLTFTAVKPSTLPRNFFDPASIGYRGADAVMLAGLATVPRTFPVYWLGMHWKGTSHVPSLAVDYVDKPGPHRLAISYGVAGDRFGPAGVQVFEAIDGAVWPG